ncbi:polyprenyl synthetase family protein [Thermodesulfobacteriota bacterium]
MVPPALKGKLAALKKAVDEAIERELEGASPGALYDAAGHLVRAGGKRLRPAILILAGESAGSPAAADPAPVLSAAAAIELIHTFTLIHDDIMDRDELRRGVDAVHVRWGESAAILAGDTLLGKSLSILGQCSADPATRLAVVNECARACVLVCEGQAMDLDFEGRDDVSLEEYWEMAEKKTSSLFTASAASGALLAGADEAQVESMRRYGSNLGLAFQARDDILGVSSTPEVLGKPVGSDVKRTKKTLVTLHALEHGGTMEELKAREEAGTLVDYLIDTGSMEYADGCAREHLDRALGALDALPEGRARTTLIDLTRWLAERKS